MLTETSLTPELQGKPRIKLRIHSMSASESLSFELLLETGSTHLGGQYFSQ